MGGGGDLVVRPPARGELFGLKARVELEGPDGWAPSANGCQPADGVVVLEPWGGVPVLFVGLNVEVGDVVRHLVAFEVHEQLEELRDFVAAPLVVLLEGHEVALVDEPVSGVLGVLAQFSVVAEQNTACVLDATANGVDAVGGGGEGGWFEMETADLVGVDLELQCGAAGGVQQVVTFAQFRAWAQETVAHQTSMPGAGWVGVGEANFVHAVDGLG